MLRMRTTVDLPLPLLEEVEQLSKARSKKEALVIALEDYVRRKRLERVLSAEGRLEFSMDAQAIRKLDRRRTRRVAGGRSSHR